MSDQKRTGEHWGFANGGGSSHKRAHLWHPENDYERTMCGQYEWPRNIVIVYESSVDKCKRCLSSESKNT